MVISAAAAMVVNGELLCERALRYAYRLVRRFAFFLLRAVPAGVADGQDGADVEPQIWINLSQGDAEPMTLALIAAATRGVAAADPVAYTSDRPVGVRIGEVVTIDPFVIANFVGRLTRMYPSKPYEALHVDVCIRTLKDFFALRRDHELFVASVPQCLDALEASFVRGSVWLHGFDAATTADVLWYGAIGYTFAVCDLSFERETVSRPMLKAWIAANRQRCQGGGDDADGPWRFSGMR